MTLLLGLWRRLGAPGLIARPGAPRPTDPPPDGRSPATAAAGLDGFDLELPPPPSGAGRRTRRESFRVWVPVVGRWKGDYPSYPFDTEDQARRFLDGIRADYDRSGRISIGLASHGGGGLDIGAAYITRQTVQRSHTRQVLRSGQDRPGEAFDLIVFRERLDDSPPGTNGEAPP